MRYMTARPLIQTGDVVFFTRPNFKDKVIRLVTRGKWSHVGVAVRATIFGTSRVFILEETPKGRQLSNMSIRADKVKVYRPADTDTETLVDYMENTGAPYSVWNAVIAGLNLPRFMKQRESHICSEMVADYLMDQGYWTTGDTLLHPSKLEKICGEIFEEVTGD